jgi:hypothetical protein
LTSNDGALEMSITTCGLAMSLEPLSVTVLTSALRDPAATPAENGD